MSATELELDDDVMTVALSVNGRRHEVAVPGHRTLLDALRDDVGLTGTKSCCAEGECGACTVLVDGTSVTSCLMLCAEAQGCEITTIEGLGSPTDGLSDLQGAFLDAGAVQCGVCIPGQVVAAEHLLRTNPTPTTVEIREAMAGNLCRCSGYQRIVAAVAATAAARAGDETTGEQP